MYKKILFANFIIGTLAIASPAPAADLPPAPTYKAPILSPIPVRSWTGFYAGGHLGGAWGHEVGTTLNTTVLALAGTQTPGNVSGFILGAQAGYNYQFSNNWVAGVEVDLSWTNASGSTTTASLVPGVFLTGRTDANWYSTLAARLGYAWGNWLLYGKAGVGWSNADYFASAVAGPAVLQTGRTSLTRSAWVLGIGGEYAFAQNWSAKLEYNYLDFGTDRVLFVFPGLGTNGANVSTHVHLVKFGVNYLFTTGPIFARY